MNSSAARLFAVIVVTLSIMACGKKMGIPENDVFTLYANAPSDKFWRSHEATFDTPYGAEFNAHKCERAQRLLQDDWHATVKTADVKFWCEKGRYRK